MRILWGDIPAEKIEDWREWNSLIEWYKANGTCVTASKTCSLDWMAVNSWHADGDDHGNFTLYVAHPSNKHDTHWRKYLYKQAGKVKITGTQAYNFVNQMYKTRTGNSIRVGFGAVIPSNFRGFSYGSLIWTNPAILHQVINHTYKLDISAAYAYQMTKILPDQHGYKKLSGRIAPSAEYPFAFYIRSNQMAIHGELDTLEWVDHPCNRTLINDRERWMENNRVKYGYAYDNRFHYLPVKEEDEITILMKAAPHPLQPEYQYMYNSRLSNPDMKDYMVKSIGAMCSANGYCNKNSHARHIASVVYARHMVKMMKLYDQIVASGAGIISMATDSIMWRQKKDNGIGVKEKVIGAPVREYSDCKSYTISQGAYAIEEDGIVKKVLHQAYAVDPGFLRRIQKVSDMEKLMTCGSHVIFSTEDYLFHEVDPNTEEFWRGE